MQPELTLFEAEPPGYPSERAGAPVPEEERVDQTDAGDDVSSEIAQSSGAPRPTATVVILVVLMVVCVSTVFSFVFATQLSAFQEQRAQHQLYAQLRGLLDPSSPVAPKIGGTIPQGFPVALVNAKQAGIHDLVVAQGTSSADLLSGPGHLPNTPLPGQKGDSVIMGKSTTAGAPFSHIGQLAKGDVINVLTGEGTFKYVVADTRSGSAKPRVLRSPSILTLITGNLSWSAGGGSHAAQLVYVDAALVGKIAGTPKGQPHTVTAADKPGSNDPNALPLVIMWLVVLLAASVACWWLWARWGLTRTWIIGAPVLFTLLWVMSSEVMRFLPNVY